MSVPMFYDARPKIFENARFLRHNMTTAEKKLWEHLSGKRMKGFRFRRQHPLLTFIADFYCHQAKLVVELDGTIHDRMDQKQYDEERTSQLEAVGLNVIRFSNHQIMHHMEDVLFEIQKHLPNPSVP